MTEFVNIAAYKFVPLDNLDDRRTSLLELCKGLGLKGTILLSPEGVNVVVAGERDSIDRLLGTFRADALLADLAVKESLSSHLPHNRMLVKIKKEIIAFGVDGIDPAKYTSPRMAPSELKARLDRGDRIQLLDVRNSFEFGLGSFENAIGLDLEDFRNFPKAVAQLPEELKERPVVTFCTGGIRCEKAAPFLERAGFREVYQLDGGILEYFEECGNSHYAGECFVFDRRVALDASLHETGTTCCFACHATLTPEERASDQFEEGQTCPHCWRPPAEKWAAQVKKRNRWLAEAASPLPGSVPYENSRPIRVSGRHDGLLLLTFLESMRVSVTPEEWLASIETGALRRDGVALQEGDVVRAGNILVYSTPGTIEPDVNPDIRILHEDEAIVVLDKPAPLPVHPSGRFNRNTLTYLLGRTCTSEKLRPAHRLDANTTGVMVFSKTRAIAGKLQPQFERGEVRKTYLVRVLGTPTESEFIVDDPVGADPTDAGARVVEAGGLSARTELRVLRSDPDGTSLLQAVPVTGRTNQIRVHLWNRDLPVVGDPVYLPGRKLGTDPSLDPRGPAMCLHAFRIEFAHPLTGDPVVFEAPAPAWA